MQLNYFILVPFLFLFIYFLPFMLVQGGIVNYSAPELASRVIHNHAPWRLLRSPQVFSLLWYFATASSAQPVCSLLWYFASARDRSLRTADLIVNCFINRIWMSVSTSLNQIFRESLMGQVKYYFPHQLRIWLQKTSGNSEEAQFLAFITGYSAIQ